MQRSMAPLSRRSSPQRASWVVLAATYLTLRVSGVGIAANVTLVADASTGAEPVISNLTASDGNTVAVWAVPLRDGPLQPTDYVATCARLGMRPVCEGGGDCAWADSTCVSLQVEEANCGHPLQGLRRQLIAGGRPRPALIEGLCNYEGSREGSWRSGVCLSSGASGYVPADRMTGVRRAACASPVGGAVEAGFLLHAGKCSVDADCVTSPSSIGTSDSLFDGSGCLLVAISPGVLKVQYFDSGSSSDVLTVGGKPYGSAAELDGLVVHAGDVLAWTTDGILSGDLGSRWRICLHQQHVSSAEEEAEAQKLARKVQQERAREASLKHASMLANTSSEAEVHKLERQVEDGRAREASLKREWAVANASLAAKVQKLTQQLAQDRAREAMLQRDLVTAKNATAEVQKLTREIEEGKAREAALKRDLATAEMNSSVQARSLMREVEASRAREAELKRDLADTRANATAQVQKLLKEVDADHAREAALRRDLLAVKASSAAEAQKLSKEVEDGKAREAALKRDLAKARADATAEVQKLKRQIEEAHDREAALQQEKVSEKTEAAEKEAELQRDLATAKAQAVAAEEEEASSRTGSTGQPSPAQEAHLHKEQAQLQGTLFTDAMIFAVLLAVVLAMLLTLLAVGAFVTWQRRSQSTDVQRSGNKGPMAAPLLGERQVQQAQPEHVRKVSTEVLSKGGNFEPQVYVVDYSRRDGSRAKCVRVQAPGCHMITGCRTIRGSVRELGGKGIHLRLIKERDLPAELCDLESACANNDAYGIWEHTLDLEDGPWEVQKSESPHGSNNTGGAVDLHGMWQVHLVRSLPSRSFTVCPHVEMSTGSDDGRDSLGDDASSAAGSVGEIGEIGEVAAEPRPTASESSPPSTRGATPPLRTLRRGDGWVGRAVEDWEVYRSPAPIEQTLRSFGSSPALLTA